METLTIAQAARHLGLSDPGVRKMIERQELFTLSGTSPVKLSAEHVETVRLLRREALLADLAARRKTPVMLASEARRVLFPQHLGANLPQHQAEAQRRRLNLVSSEARQLFGTAAMTAACASEGCRWCLSADFARVLGGWAPTEYSEGFRELFGQEPCERCGPGLYGAVLASLNARVYQGAQTPPGGRAEAPAPRMRAEPRQVVSERVTAAQPVQGGDGKELVSRRLRATRVRLKAAERSGDRAYAAQLRKALKTLTADASVVDRRSVSSRPGTLRCGHALAANCACPRRASKRSTS
jgi:hypothetical protein